MTVSRNAVIAAVSIASLAGCGESQQPIGAPGKAPLSSAMLRRPGHPMETIVYAFQGGNDGASPGGALAIDASGALYGATGWGGSPNCYNGCGTVFKLTPSGSGFTESILYKFQGGSDGDLPSSGGLTIDRTGALYGTAVGGTTGCPPECGTVYKLTPIKSGYGYAILYRFKGGSDGYDAYGGVMVDSSGDVYGTTAFGGAYGGGTAYKLRPTRSRYKKSTIFNFSTSGDAEPIATLLRGKEGTLYGTALFDSVFELTPTRSRYTERILHAFTGSPDGSLPYGSVIGGGSGQLYGTTTEGGATSRCKKFFGCGTVYELSPTKHGYRETLFSFQHRNGAYPGSAVLLGKDGALYGTTGGGGLTTCPGRDPTYGCGVAFKLKSTRVGFEETILHEFSGGSDGAGPSSPLVADNSGTLYGATGGGGGTTGCQGGCGVIFRLVP